MPVTCILPPTATVSRPRRALRLLTAASLVLAGAVLGLVGRALGTEGRIRLANTWSRLLLRALGVRIQVRQGFTFVAPRPREGGFSPGPAVNVVTGPPAAAESFPGTAPLIVANHVSWLDPVVLSAALPCRLLAKREIRSWPVIGGLATGAGALFIDRDRLSALPEAVTDVAGALARGHAVTAFPEGTTWCGREMGSFRPAVFQAALDAGAPVRPVAIRYLDAYGAPATGPAFVGDDTLTISIRRVASLRRLTVEVTLLPPVTARDRRTLAWLAESSVASVVVTPAEYAGHGVRSAA
ncbi:lysophospholipid acyltransferase family protein [Planobispora longispora]|uniref:1-acyl-sn-glycerol-3-phosphate acyltransferase n=1 Tax=Planobispora longispora TaxID=28887 RepID=A0A8J3RYE2_9ACTN|nr:lysophospholipid acyltransferase family protein [Planobispora longispora]BFE85508.1 lysophospholipid acyltransferase family protein [Planobispora longispora]GIH80398.1 1-acyl-sn-glycerol-3-phosphate acyltransferase [Planobispora longispora]